MPTREQAKIAANNHSQIIAKLRAHWQKTGFYEYQDENRNPIYWKIRLDPLAHSNEKKWIRPLHFDGKEWLLKEPSFENGKKLLYRLPEIITNSHQTIWIVAGERCVDQLVKLGLHATTSGGADSILSTNWQPLAGQSIVIWPDNDAAGLRYAQEATKQLQILKCYVRWIDIQQLHLPGKGDVIDWLKVHPLATSVDIENLPCIDPPISPSTDTQEIEPIRIDLKTAILDYSELFTLQLPERIKLLPWLPEGGLVMIAAERGIGKTHFASSLACALANGNKFMVWNVVKPVGVLFIDGEMALMDVRERLSRIMNTLPKEPLKTLSHEYFFNKFERDLSITDLDTQQEVLTLLDNDPSLRVLILDNLSSLTHIREDKSDDWRSFMLPFLIACRRRSIAVVLIHHCGKLGEQRGTGARGDHLDTSIKLTKLEESSLNDGCKFKVTFTKLRGCYGEVIKPFIATLNNSEQASTWKITSIEESTKDRLIHLVSESGDEGMSVTEVAEKLSLTKGRISILKKQCEEEGIFQYATGKTPMRIALNWKVHK